MRYYQSVPKNIKTVRSLVDWMDEYVEATAGAVTQSLNSQADMIGDDNARVVAMALVATLVGTILYKELKLKATSDGSQKDKSDAVTARFAEAKLLMQQAVSAGFESAMVRFTGKPIEYYCLVKPVPKAPSESVN